MPVTAKLAVLVQLPPSMVRLARLSEGSTVSVPPSSFTVPVPLKVVVGPRVRVPLKAMVVPAGSL